MAAPSQSTIWFPAAVLRSVAVMSEVRRILTGVVSGPHLNSVCLVLSELFANAIEHGLLDMDSRIKEEPDGFTAFYQMREQRMQELSDEYWVSLSVDHQPDSAQITMTLEHNGTGFDCANLQKEIDESSTHGRGIMLAATLCDSLEYSKQGKCVTAVYRLNSDR